MSGAFRVNANHGLFKAACYLPVLGDIGAKIAYRLLDPQIPHILSQSDVTSYRKVELGVSVFKVKQQYRKACIANNFIGTALVITGFILGFFTTPWWAGVCLIGFMGMGAWNIYKFQQHSQFIKESNAALAADYESRSESGEEVETQLRKMAEQLQYGNSKFGKIVLAVEMVIKKIVPS